MGKLKLFFACLLMTVLSIGQVWADDVTIQYTNTSTTTNMTGGNDAATVGLDATHWSVVGAKGGNSNFPGLNKSKYIALYYNATASNTLTVTNLDGATINSIKITYTSNNYNNGKVIVGGSEVTGSSGEYDIDATSFVVTNGNTSNIQVRISKIEITYTPSGGGGSSKEDLTNEQLSWSAASASITFGDEPYSLPSLTNSIPVSLTYESTDATVATISNVGVVSVLKAGSTTIKAIFAGDDDYNAKTVSYTLTVAPAPLTPIEGGIIDELIISDFGVTGGYTAFTGKQASNEGHSNAVYAGTVARNGNATQYNIQLNGGQTSNKLREIATSTSGGYAKRVQAIWATQTANTAGRKLTVYGSTTAYSGSETAAAGNKLGELTYATGNPYAYIDIDDDYEYIQIVADNAIYMDQINITWISSAVAVAKPTITGAEKFVTSTTVSIGCTTTGAEIYYTLDGSDPQISDSKQLYSDPFSLTVSGSVNARAKLDNDWSGMTTKTFVKVDPIDVPDAIALIPNADDVVNDQYVAGIVCTAAPSLLTGGKLTYYISADGSETNRLQIFKGKNLNNTEFTAVSDLAIGDRVVVFGQLKNYNNTPEMNDGNYLVERVAALVAAPVFTPDGGGFMGETDVTITCATAGSVIYYTTDGETPSKLSTPYTAAIHLDATTTIKAIAYVNDDPSIVITKTFTLSAPMTVAEALTALDSEDPINNVAVAGIISTAPTNNPSSGRLTYYISDDGSTTSQLEVFNGYGLNGASFSDKTDLQIGDEVTVFGNLKIFSGSSGDVKEFDAGNRLLAFNRPEVPVTAVEMAEVTAEIEVGSTVTLHAHVMPENATDQSLSWTVESGSDKASVDENGVVTGVAEGTAVIRAASPDYPYYAECTVTVTAADPTKHVVTFDATVDKGESPLSKSNITFTCSNGILNNGTEYRLYKNSTNTFECSAGYITKIEFTGVSGNPVSGFEDPEVGTLVIDGNDGVWTGNAESISFIASGAQVRATQINITYKEDNREEAGIAFTPENVSITEGEPWSEPVFTNPHDLDVTFSSNNESVAKVSDAGAVSLQDGTGTAVITATFDGDDTYKPATVTYTITVNAPLSPWATTWTSNLDDITGFKVKFYGEETEYAALKAGTGSVAGTATLNIPAQATELHLHAYGWNSEDVTLSITAPDGVTVTPASITLNRNSGFAGNSPFTLAEGSTPQTDAYYALSLSGNTDAIELTISATEGKRFLLFGVNQVGGVLPELQSIAISGDLTNKEYEAGQAIDMTGLTVEATYTLAGVPQTPVDITDDPNLEWSYAPLVKDQTSVEITASFEGKNAQKTIDGLTVTEATPAITASPSFANFNNVSKDALVAAKTINVTLTNVATATVALSGTGADAFLIDKNSLDASGTISITPVTTTIGNYSAKITISDDAGVATAATVTIMMNVMPVDEGDALLSGVWTLVTDASQLIDGSKVIIAQYVNADGAIRTMSTQNTNNRASVESTVAGTSLTPAEGTRVMTLEALAGGKYAFRTNINTYLYAASSSSNYLKEELELNDNGRWTISIEDGNKAVITATGTNSHRIMRYNEGSELFSCYESGQKDVQLFIRTADFARTDMFSPGVIGTVCVDHNVPFAGIEGATFYELAGLVSTGFIAFDEIVSGQLEAGVPYLFQASANELKLYYGTTTVPSPVNPGNGMYGTFDPIDVTENLDDVYYFAQHNFWSCSGMSSLHMPANRAYVRMSEVPSAAPNPNPGRRRVVMGVNGTNTTTGCENIESGNAPRKQLINGAIYIIRGEKVYDTTGRLVK